MIVIGLFGMVGFLAFFVGGIITYPMSIILMTLLYRDLKKFKEENNFPKVENHVIEEKTENI